MPKSIHFTANPLARSHRQALQLSVLTAAAALLLAGAPRLFAQEAAAPAPSASSGHKVLNHHKRASASKLVAAQPAPPVPPAPIDPHWPANDRPNQASVTWDSHGLRIEASNSSLQQILKDVATVTGAKVEGMAADERVFGAYGPGLARDVVSQLLQGSSYNVLMIGDQGQGAPRQIVLSSRHSGNAPNTPAAADANGNGDDESDVDQDDQAQPVAPPIRPNFGPGSPPRTPQQMLQEMQQRQQELQQQQQQNQQPH